jgi:hypothetical protein
VGWILPWRLGAFGDIPGTVSRRGLRSGVHTLHLGSSNTENVYVVALCILCGYFMRKS